MLFVCRSFFASSVLFWIRLIFVTFHKLFVVNRNFGSIYSFRVKRHFLFRELSILTSFCEKFRSMRKIKTTEIHRFLLFALVNSALLISLWKRERSKFSRLGWFLFGFEATKCADASRENKMHVLQILGNLSNQIVNFLVRKLNFVIFLAFKA